MPITRSDSGHSRHRHPRIDGRLPAGGAAFAALVLIVSAAFADGSFWLPPDFGKNNPKVAAAIGDSITVGVQCTGSSCSIVQRPYPAALQSLLNQEHPSFVVLNRGVGGETTAGGLARLSAVLAVDRPGFVLVMEGINGATFGVSPATVVANLQEMVRLAKANNSIPILGAITPNFRDAPEAKAIIAEVNAMLPQVAADEGVRFVDTFSPMNDVGLYSPDLLHPNQTGYDVLGAAWQAAVTDGIRASQALVRGVPVAGAHLGGAPTERHVITGTGQGPEARVRTFGPDNGAFGPTVTPYAAAFRGGVRVAACDFTGDGRHEIVTGKGVGSGSRVKLLELDAAGALAATLASFKAFEPGLPGGVFVACGDLDGDTVPDIVVAAGRGGAPQVRAFRFAAGEPGGVVDMGVNFLAYGPNFDGGVTVAVADLDNDGQAEIITGKASDGRARVRAFRYAPAAPGGVEDFGLDFFAFDPAFTGGVLVAASDLDGDGRAELITGAGRGGSPHVRILRRELDGTLTEVAGFLPYSPNFRGGVFVGVSGSEVITGKGPGGSPRVRGFTADGGPTTTDFLAY